MALRSVMADRGVDAYIVPLDDEGRREWLSGFTGSNGDCVVTNDLVGAGAGRGRNTLAFSITLGTSVNLNIV